MINYIEKGPGLHQAIQAAGHVLREENGNWISSDDNAVQAIIDSYDPIPQTRDLKWREIQMLRDKLVAVGVLVGGNVFHSDTTSRIQQLGLVMMGQGMPTGLMWKTVGGAFVEMTPALALQIFQATAASDSAIFKAAEIHKAQVWALTKADDIQAYDFSAGWPKA